MHRFVKALFWSALLFTFVMATLPKPPQLPGAPSDKIQHILAFLVLGGLARLAFPPAAAWRLLLALSCFGALIEIVQAIPWLHRDAEMLDWMADTAAAAAALGALYWGKLKYQALRRTGSGRAAN